MANLKQINLTTLRELILAQFDQEELRTLAFDMNVEYDDLRGEGRRAKARELVDHLQRRQKIEELLTYCRQKRPNGKWDTVFQESIPLSLTADVQLPHWLWAAGGFGVILIATFYIFLRPILSGATNLSPSPIPELTVALTPTPIGTPTPLTPRPISVAFSSTNCDEETITTITNEINAAGGIIKSDTGLLNVEVHCNEDRFDIYVQMPTQPAYRLEFLDEPEHLKVTAESVYVPSFIRAILYYSTGNYRQAIDELKQSENILNISDIYLLHGHAHMHSAQWPEARLRYEKALEINNETAAQAHLQASIGTAYIMEVSQDINTHSTCTEMAVPLFNQAINLDPERAFWWAGRAWARYKCSREDPTTGMQNDIREALHRAQDQSIDQALALFLEALFLSNITDEIDQIKAESDIQQAIQISPDLAIMYQLSSCIHYKNDDGETAEHLHQEYISRLTFDWQIDKAQFSHDNHAYCD